MSTGYFITRGVFNLELEKVKEKSVVDRALDKARGESTKSIEFLCDVRDGLVKDLMLSKEGVIVEIPVNVNQRMKAAEVILKISGIEKEAGKVETKTINRVVFERRVIESPNKNKVIDSTIIES